MKLLKLQPQEVPPVGQRALLRREGLEIVLFNIDGQVYAIGDTCPHAGSSLCTGRLDGHLIQCPAHGLRFDVRTGAMPGNPALRTATYPVLASDGGHALELPDAAG